MEGGSRFGILSSNSGELMVTKFKKQNPVVMGKKFDSEKNMAGNFALYGNRKKLGKDKGKRVVIFVGTKVKANALKPNNSIGLGSGASNPFDNEAKMVRKI